MLCAPAAHKSERAGMYGATVCMRADSAARGSSERQPLNIRMEMQWRAAGRQFSVMPPPCPAGAARRAPYAPWL